MAAHKTHFVFQSSALKPITPSLKPAVKMQRTDYKFGWEKNCHWLYLDNEQDGMFCKLC